MVERPCKSALRFRILEFSFQQTFFVIMRLPGFEPGSRGPKPRRLPGYPTASIHGLSMLWQIYKLFAGLFFLCETFLKFYFFSAVFGFSVVAAGTVATAAAPGTAVPAASAAAFSASFAACSAFKTFSCSSFTFLK